jgi:hypothetical protein
MSVTEEPIKLSNGLWLDLGMAGRLGVREKIARRYQRGLALPTGHVVSASRIGDRRMIPARGYRLADLLRVFS